MNETMKKMLAKMSVEEAYREGFSDAFRQCWDRWGQELCSNYVPEKWFAEKHDMTPGTAHCRCIVALFARLDSLDDVTSP